MKCGLHIPFDGVYSAEMILPTSAFEVCALNGVLPSGRIDSAATEKLSESEGTAGGSRLYARLHLLLVRAVCAPVLAIALATVFTASQSILIATSQTTPQTPQDPFLA